MKPPTALKTRLSDPERLAALRGLGLLDTPPTEAFDRLTRMAARLLRASVAMVSLVDERRQFIKSIAAADDRWGSLHELPVDDGYCRFVVEQGGPVAIDDARRQPELDGNRAVDELGLVAYAGVPLVTGDGHVLGTLCALADHPRTWSGEDLELLGELAGAAMTAVDLHARGAEAQARGRALERLVRERTATLVELNLQLRQSELDLRTSHEQTIRRLSSALEARNRETGWHVERMSRYSGLLAHRLGLDPARCELIRIAAPLHDIGKIAIPDQILLKPGPLTPAERDVIETHAAIGHQMLTGSGEPLLDLAARIALTHHERADGRGYPNGLAGDAVPLEGQIAAVTDVFDALISDRVYRPAYSLECAVAMLERERGRHFDPVVLDTFMDSLDDVVAINDRYLALHQEDT